MKVLLSIKPEYAAKILSGEKKFEFRKVSFLSSAVNTVVIYATKPIGKVVGEFSVLNVISDSPSAVWEKTKRFAGIDKKFFDQYYEGRKVAVAIAVGDVQEYDIPLDLSVFGDSMTPPQSFCYIKGADRKKQHELEFS